MQAGVRSCPAPGTGWSRPAQCQGARPATALGSPSPAAEPREQLGPGDPQRSPRPAELEARATPQPPRLPSSSPECLPGAWLLGWSGPPPTVYFLSLERPEGGSARELPEVQVGWVGVQKALLRAGQEPRGWACWGSLPPHLSWNLPGVLCAREQKADLAFTSSQPRPGPRGLTHTHPQGEEEEERAGGSRRIPADLPGQGAVPAGPLPAPRQR